MKGDVSMKVKDFRRVRVDLSQCSAYRKFYNVSYRTVYVNASAAPDAKIILLDARPAPPPRPTCGKRP